MTKTPKAQTKQLTPAKPVRVSIGSIWGVPLEGGGWGAVIVREMGRRKGAIHDVSLYGFDREWTRPPSAEDVQNLKITDVCYVFSGGDGIRSGRWTYSGHTSTRGRAEWPEAVESAGGSKFVNGVDRYFSWLDPDCQQQHHFESAGLAKPGEADAIIRPYGGGPARDVEFELAAAIREHDPIFFHKFTPRMIAIWDRIVHDAIAQGRITPTGKPPQRPLFVRRVEAPRTKEIPSLDALIEECAAAKTATQCGKLAKAALKGAAKQSIRQIVKECKERLKASNTWDLWAAAWIMNGGCSDDGFLYFRGWLIAQGAEAWTKAVASPDSLADLKPRFGRHGGFECEDLLLAIEDEAMEIGSEVWWPEALPKGKATWDEDDGAGVERICPRLWKKFGRHMN